MALSRVVRLGCGRARAALCSAPSGHVPWRTEHSAATVSSAKEEAEIDHALQYYPYFIQRHGKREVIGHGNNGDRNYIDLCEIPMPAVRFREETPHITALREKEKGDWHKLTHAEVKDLYRHTFCMTFAEMNAPSGEWKLPLTFTMLNFGVGLWLFLFCVHYVYMPYPEEVTDPEKLRATYQLLLDNREGAMYGMAADFDYEAREWKK